jgi:hypothetical protein
MKSFFVLSTVCLLLNSLAHADDITSTVPGRDSFIKITLVSATSDEKTVRFEQCTVKTPTDCKTIGTRDYTLTELQSLHDELLNQADSDKSWTFFNALEVLGGVVGGAAVGCAAGAVIGGVAGAGIFLGSVAYGLAGCGVGVIAGGIGGGVGVYYWVESTKTNEVDQLDNEAQEIEALLNQIPNATKLP